MARPSPPERSPFISRRTFWLLVALAVLIGVVLVFVALQRRILFPRHQIPPPPKNWPRPPGIVRVDVRHADGISEGWLMPGDGVSAEHPGPLVIFGHGNGELIDYAAPALVPYRRLGVSVGLVEYRGYGRSDGSPSEDAIVADLVAFHDALVARPEIDGARVVLHGRSLGGGAVCGLARRRPPRALVLESSFISVPEMARRMGLPGFLVRDVFDNLGAVRTYPGPVLVMHGTEDELIPFAHGEALAAAAQDARFVSFRCGHNDLPPEPARYWAEITDLLRRAGVIGQSSPPLQRSQ
ncbi:MAG: alpha/beta hydrolase [Myxococcales bacterium]|nr:alpha/beta hydrolase [Myxococcales bacterium]